MIKKVFILTTLFLVVLLAFFVRKKNYAEIPIPGQSTDEYSYSWVGLSLLKTGMPVAVSGFPGYKNLEKRYLNVDHYMQVIPSDPFEINYPWMDHPPLLGLITGGYAYANGARVFGDISSLVIRKPIIVIGSLSVALAIIFSYINFGYVAALFTGLIYATAPLVVLSSRMIQAENAIIPCILACLISISLYLKNKGDKWLFISALIAGGATLFKLTGIVCYLIIIFSLFIKYKKINKLFWKDLSFFLAISLPISFLFVIYGLVYGWENFQTILFSNYNRFYGIGVNSILELVRNQRLTQHKFLPEIWVISGWFVFFASLIKTQKNIGDKLIKLAIIAYLIVYIFFGSQPYGWYTFPFWPLLIIGLGRFLSLGLTKSKNLFAVILMLLIVVGANIDRLINVFEFQKYSQFWRFGVSGIIFLFVLSELLKIKRTYIIKLLVLIIFAGAILLNIKYLGQINIDFWWGNIS
ncbi:MAG TPA: glycosyltransferase family 39 protein [Candidatus Methanoperedens sp.]|nr:glycosyltransferase family 39 protein [Candidatus Methanoperedens sp.]